MRSAHFGRMPVARNEPTTFPASLMPLCWNKKISCMAITSCSMPVISEIDVTRRLPSVSRVTWMHDVDGGRDLLAHRLVGNVQVRHCDHRVEAIQRVARAVGVDGRQAAVVAGVHRLEHVQRFLAAHLADDDAVGSHTQCVDHELPLTDRPLALDVGRTRLEPHHVPLPQRQFRGILDSDHAL